MASFNYQKGEKKLFLERSFEKLGWLIECIDESKKFPMCTKAFGNTEFGYMSDFYWNGIEVKLLGDEFREIYINYTKSQKFVSRYNLISMPEKDSQIKRNDILTEIEQHNLFNLAFSLQSLYDFDPEATLVYYAD
jgi:hypothetical protein